jgi:hypothetical protein
MTRFVRTLLALALPLAAACGGDGGGGAPPAGADTAAAAPLPGAERPHAWRANPAEGVSVRNGDTLLVETGPHAILWQTDGHELAPPYTLRATIEKRAGRLHEGVGVVFGGTGLEGAESGQVYSYFLVRGDGSFLIKRRQGAELPVVRDWTTHPAIRRDADDAGRPNTLEVVVTAADVAFRINGAEVARVPAAELSVAGRAGLRVSHDVQLAVSEFAVEGGGEAPAAVVSPAGLAPVPADSGAPSDTASR